MNLTKAAGSTHKIKRIGRGQGSGMGKTATKGAKVKPLERVIMKKEVLKEVSNLFKEDYQKLVLLLKSQNLM
ncbi:LSU ribosomal protein L15p (L27Ae) [Campylobacter coli]|nr:LSU ribosomal protein L15p (L27Ae) [Campylobacter coli]